MRIGLVNIGDELLLGKTLNTNAFDAAGLLAELGHELAFAWVIGDGLEAIQAVLRSAFAGDAALRCEMLLVTGGLGPTADDRTREAVAGFLGVPLVFSAEAAAWLSERLGVSADAIPAGQHPQLEIPSGARALRNPAGTACGFACERAGATLFALPGVPAEFRALFDAHCRPLLERRDASLLRRRIVTFELPESRQRELLRGFVPPPPFRYSSLPTESGVVIALEAFVPLNGSAASAAVETRLDAAWNDLLGRLPPECIVDRSGLPLTQAVLQLLRDRRATVATAESCTAGALGYLLTETPGSSAVFRQGYLTYADEAKTQMLGVSADLIARHGAVSEPVALAMARGCLAAAGADYAVSITGIAGPEGGSPEKPVGLVYMAVASKRQAEAYRFQFRGDRKSIRWRSAYTALNRLRLFIFNELPE